MPATPNTGRYNSVSIWLHWLMLALIAGAYATIELRGFYPRGSATREALKNWHYWLGLTVLLFVWLRIVARLVWKAPAPVERGWRDLASKATHGALYVLMIAMPLAGWAILSAEGDPVSFFGLRLPALVAEDRPFAKTLEEIHELGGTIGYWLIGLHAAAALFHQYVLRDRLLERMAPRRG